MGIAGGWRDGELPVLTGARHFASPMWPGAHRAHRSPELWRITDMFDGPLGAWWWFARGINSRATVTRAA